MALKAKSTTTNVLCVVLLKADWLSKAAIIKKILT